MNHHARDTPVNRLDGLLRRRRPRARTACVRTSRGEAPWLFEPLDLPHFDPPGGRTDVPGFAPLGTGAEYRYRHAAHELILAFHGVTGRHEAAVGRDEAEFALVVEGPLLVFRYRFGMTIPWSSAAPYNWHFAPPSERVLPAALAPTPETYARLWATLWITLVDAADGQVRAHRAVALRPEFTHALNGVLRAQALQPFHGAAADRALDRLRYASNPLTSRPLVTTRCPGFWVPDADRPRTGWHDRFRALR